MNLFPKWSWLLTRAFNSRNIVAIYYIHNAGCNQSYLHAAAIGRRRWIGFHFSKKSYIIWPGEYRNYSTSHSSYLITTESIYTKDCFLVNAVIKIFITQILISLQGTQHWEYVALYLLSVMSHPTFQFLAS